MFLKSGQTRKSQHFMSVMFITLCYYNVDTCCLLFTIDAVLIELCVSCDVMLQCWFAGSWWTAAWWVVTGLSCQQASTDCGRRRMRVLGMQAARRSGHGVRSRWMCHGKISCHMCPRESGPRSPHYAFSASTLSVLGGKVSVVLVNLLLL